MPGSRRAELTAELRILPERGGAAVPKEQVAAGERAAAESGLAREGGPDVTLLAGKQDEVLDALRRTVEAALDAGAQAVEVRVEAERDAGRF